jgi:hypothetical protein
MKKKPLLLLLAIGLVAANSSAQSFTLAGGATLSTLSWDLEHISSADPKYGETLVGYSVFAGVDYVERRYFSLAAHLGMLRRGGSSQLTTAEQQLTEQLTLDYLSLNTTLDLKYPLGGGRYLPFVSVGPRLDYLVGHSRHFDLIEDMNQLRSLAAGMLLGAGGKVAAGNLLLGLRADYYLNFGPVADWRKLNPGQGGRISVSTLALSLTVSYRKPPKGNVHKGTGGGYHIKN